MSIKALERHLLPLKPFLEMKGVTEICINQPGKVYVEQHGRFTLHELPELELEMLHTLAALVAEFNAKDFPIPLLAGSLPCGARIQFVLNPACEKDKIICSIRKQQMLKLTLEDYAKSGTFDELVIQKPRQDLDQLKKLYQQKEYLTFLRLAIRSRLNILISGGTGTGKTTFLNACLQNIPDHERIITVEDTREVIVDQPNTVHLLFNDDDPAITSLNVFKTCLRLRPDRLFLSELRGAEVWPYLRAANSGHPGSLSTVHADTPEGAFTQLTFMMQQAGSTSTEEQISAYIKSIIHVVIQLKSDKENSRFMYVSDIYFSGADCHSI